MRKQFKLGFIICFCLALMGTLNSGRVSFVQNGARISISKAGESDNHRLIDEIIVNINDLAIAEIRNHPSVFFRYQRLIESSEFLQSAKNLFLRKYYNNTGNKKDIPVENELFYRALKMQEKKIKEVK